MSQKSKIKTNNQVKIKKESLEGKLSPTGQKALNGFQAQIQQIRSKKLDSKQKSENSQKQLLLKIINSKKQPQPFIEQIQKENMAIFSPKNRLQTATSQQESSSNKVTFSVGTKYSQQCMQQSQIQNNQQNVQKKTKHCIQQNLPESQQFKYEEMNSESEEFLDTMDEGSSVAPVAKQNFVSQKHATKNIVEQKSAQKPGPYYAQENRGRGSSRESAPSRSHSRRGKEFQKELAKCGGLLHEDPTLRPHEAIKMKGKQLELTAKEQEIETIGNGIFPFQRRARSFSPKRELSFGGSVKLFPQDQESTSTINSTINNQSQSRVEPIKADYDCFQKQQLTNQQILQSSLNFGNFMFTSTPFDNQNSNCIQMPQEIQQNQQQQSN